MSVNLSVSSLTVSYIINNIQDTFYKYASGSADRQFSKLFRSYICSCWFQACWRRFMCTYTPVDNQYVTHIWWFGTFGDILSPDFIASFLWLIDWMKLFILWNAWRANVIIRHMELSPVTAQGGWQGSKEEFFHCSPIRQSQSEVSRCQCWTLCGQLWLSCQIWCLMKWSYMNEGWICQRVLWNTYLFDKEFCTGIYNHEPTDSSEALLPHILSLKNSTFCCTLCFDLETVVVVGSQWCCWRTASVRFGCTHSKCCQGCSQHNQDLGHPQYFGI